MKEILYKVGVKHKKTGERINLYVWAKNVDEATYSLSGILFGYDREYVWTGTAPEYKNNEVVSRNK